MAKGLKVEDGVGVWTPVLINNYDKATQKYQGYWDDDLRDFGELYRINLLFDSEDPRIFA